MPKENREVATRDAVPAANRAKAIVASLRVGEPSSAEVFEAFGQLDELPVDAVRDALTSWMGPLPDLYGIDDATRRAHNLPLRPLRLRTLATAHDADLLDLGPIAERQLRLAGKSWDGADLAAEERLDGELEGSFAGTLERRVLGDADAVQETPLFDVLQFAGHAGVVFSAGTTKQIALIAYGRVELRDRRTRIAIEEAIAAPDVTSPPESSPAIAAKVDPPKKAAAKKAAPKKEAAPPKEAAPKKEAAVKKKTAPKKTAPKKAAPKKAAPKKTAAVKKAAPKKTAAVKKAAPKKKAAVKKAAPKKKKAAVKKAAPKKAAPKKKVAVKKAAPKKKAAKKKEAAKKK